PVTISVSRHTRLPRLYRGRDIMWWLDQYGIAEDEVVSASELEAARWQPSMQLVGQPERDNLDLLAARHGCAACWSRRHSEWLCASAQQQSGGGDRWFARADGAPS